MAAPSNLPIHCGARLIALLALSLPLTASAKSVDCAGCGQDEIWMINTRCITSDACRADLEHPGFSVSRFDGQRLMLADDFNGLLAAVHANPTVTNVIYVHGNNFEQSDVMPRAWFVYQKIKQCRLSEESFRFIIWSWPSQPETTLLKDVRLKAERTDAQGLYLATVIRQISNLSSDTVLIGYSFGGRVVTGATHALAGGRLGGRSIPGEHMMGMRIRVGLVAPALDRDWLMAGAYHGLATKNIDRIALMYNPRDQVLRRYWLLDPGDVSGALGTVGEMRFGSRADGSLVPVDSYNCSRAIGRKHREEDYYSQECCAGCVMARLID